MSWGAVVGGAITIGGGLIMNNQKQKSIEGAANAQKATTKTALAEEQRQYDLNMAEYQRKQAILEQQMQQTTQLMSPFIQSGQGALYEMLALSGIAVPAQPVVPQGITPTQPSASEMKSLLPSTSINASGQTAQATQTEPGKVGILSGRGETITGGTQGISSTTSPYAGMTGEEAQQAAISKIADSPLLKELMAQGEQAMLQQASATGGLRGGNIQGALAQYRPQMLQQAIDEQYARLGNLSGSGLTAIQQLPNISNVGSMPQSGAGEYLSRMGDISAAQQIASGKSSADLYGDIASGLGTVAGAYFDQRKK